MLLDKKEPVFKDLNKNTEYDLLLMDKIQKYPDSKDCIGLKKEIPTRLTKGPQYFIAFCIGFLFLLAIGFILYTVIYENVYTWEPATPSQVQWRVATRGFQTGIGWGAIFGVFNVIMCSVYGINELTSLVFLGWVMGWLFDFITDAG